MSESRAAPSEPVLDPAAQLEKALAGDREARWSRRRRWVFWLKRTRTLDRFGSGLHQWRFLFLYLAAIPVPLKWWWRLTYETRLPWIYRLVWGLCFLLLFFSTRRLERGLSRLARSLRSRIAAAAVREGVDLTAYSDRKEKRRRRRRH